MFYSLLSLSASKTSLTKQIAALKEDGVCHDEINGLLDALSHYRSGCAQELYAGKGLIQEMQDDPSWDSMMSPSHGVVTNEIKSAVRYRAGNWEEDSGVIEASWTKNPTIYRDALECETLGTYTFKTNYSIPFKCTGSGNSRTCKVDSSFSIIGSVVWSGKQVPLLAPYFVVTDKKSKAFRLNYAVRVPIKFSIKVPKGVPIVDANHVHHHRFHHHKLVPRA